VESPTPPVPSSQTGGLRGIRVAVLFYLGLFVIVTWPLCLHPSTAIVTDHGDGFFDMLMFHYARDGRLFQPEVRSLFFPWGVPLGAEQGYWLVPLLSVPLQAIMPLPLVFNILCLSFFVATATSTYLLVKELDLDDAAAIFGGALVVLSPSFLNEMSAGILENMALFWPVLYLWCGLRLRRRPSVRLALLAGTLLAAAFLTSWYLAVFAAAFTFLLPLRRIWPAFVLAGVLLVLPLIHAVSIASEAGHVYDPRVARALVSGGASGVDLGSSQATLQVLGDSTDWSLLLTRARSGRRMQFLPGVLLLGLAMLGLWSAFHPAWRWGALALACIFLALGPWLVWSGRGIAPLPTEWLYVHLPLMARLRPVRWLLPATVGLAILAAYALPASRSRLLRWSILCGLVFLQGFEALWIQVPSPRLCLSSATVPEYYDKLARGEGGIIDMPLFPYMLSEGRHLYFQSVHNRPMLNYNFVTRASQQRLFEVGRDNRLIGALLDLDEPIRRSDVDEVSRLGYTELLLHTRVPQPASESSTSVGFSSLAWRRLVTIYGPPREAGDHILSFDLRHPLSAAFDSRGLLDNGPVARLAPHAQPLPIRFTEVGAGQWSELDGWVYGAARLSVTCNGKRLAEAVTAEGQWEWVSLALPKVSGTIEVTAEPRLQQEVPKVVDLTLWGRGDWFRKEAAHKPQRHPGWLSRVRERERAFPGGGPSSAAPAGLRRNRAFVVHCTAYVARPPSSLFPSSRRKILQAQRNTTAHSLADGS
jgi:hypothetical protein